MPRTMRNVKAIIEQTLDTFGQLTWTQLWEKSQLSKGAVSKHLNDLLDWERVERIVDTKKRPPEVLYKLVEVKSVELPKALQDLEGYDNLVKAATITAFREGLMISEMKDRSTAENVLKGYLKAHLFWIGGWLAVQFGLAHAYAKGRTGVKFGEALKGPKKIKMTHDVFQKKIRKDIHDFLEPWVEALAQTHFANRDISDEVFEQTARELAAQVDTSWYYVLEKSERKRVMVNPSKTPTRT